MEVLLPAIILEDEEDDLLIYCMSEGATDIFKKRKDEGYYSTLIGRYLDGNKRRHNNSKLQSMADTDFS
jgi:hypothetical protein